MPCNCASACCTAATSGVRRRSASSPSIGRRVGEPVVRQATGDQVGDHFGVGRRAETVAFAFQPLLERAEVLDHAVVDDGHDAVAAEVRMGVDVGRRAVRGPAGVADADRCRRRVALSSSSQVVDAAGRFGDVAASPSSKVATPELS